jgi:sarcosine oxidase, subunit beta
MKHNGTPEVVIVGAGVMGCAIAYELALAGVRVMVLEKESVAYGGSGRNGGGVRAQWRFPTEFRWAMASVEMFKDLDQELEIDSELQPTGNLILAASEAELQEHHASVVEQRKAGLDTLIVTREEVFRLAPALDRRAPIVGARYCSTDGSCNPITVTYGYANAARRHGVRFLLHTPVLSVATQGGAAVGVETSAGRIPADIVILAAGPWSVSLAEPLGFHLPIVPVRHHVMVTEPIPPLMEAFGIHLGSGSWWRQAKNGSMHIGFGQETPPTFGQQVDPTWAGEASKSILKFLPALRRVKVIRCWAGLYDVTPDACHIVDWAPGIENLLLVTGFSGHGFALGPITGRLVKELLTDDRTSLPLEPVSLGRFDTEESRRATIL